MSIEKVHSIRRGFLEVLTIVGGILLAFAIDAWWDERQEAEQQEVLLLSLQDEFVFHRSELVRHMERWQRVQEHMGRLLTTVHSEALPPVAVMDTLIQRATASTTFDPRSGAADALIASGQLSWVDDPELRARLAAWQGVVDEVRDNEVLMRDFKMMVLLPYLAREGVPIARARATASGGYGLLGGDDSADGWPAPLMTTDDAARKYGELLADPEFESLVAATYWTINVGEYADAIAFVDEILELLSTNLGGG